TLAERVQEAQDKLTPLLAKYGVSMTKTMCRTIEPPHALEMVAVLSPESFRKAIVDQFERHDIDRALELAEMARDAMEKQPVGAGARGNYLAITIADFNNRIGFLRLLKGDGVGALDALTQSIDLSEDEAWIKRANIGYAYALTGEFSAA